MIVLLSVAASIGVFGFSFNGSTITTQPVSINGFRTLGPECNGAHLMVMYRDVRMGAPRMFREVFKQARRYHLRNQTNFKRENDVA